MITNYLTIDVEDYFQVSAFEKFISPDRWDSYDCGVEENTDIILNLLSVQETHATFFITGWIAERYPALVLKIHNQGHEIGCHSYWHKKVYDLSPDQFKEDTRRAKDVLEDIVSKPIIGYRAPSYSITSKSLWALDILAELGFTYDSSIFPIYHDVYGIPGSPRFKYFLEDHGLWEYPITTLQLPAFRLPVAGGGYFRIFPYWFTRLAFRTINNREKKPFIFYIHPWELNPDQPRIQNVGLKTRFRHYHNLKKTGERLSHLLNDFQFSSIAELN